MSKPRGIVKEEVEVKHYVVFYQLAEDARATAALGFPSHTAAPLARVSATAAPCLMAGNLRPIRKSGWIDADLPPGREASEEFVKGDPFCSSGGGPRLGSSGSGNYWGAEL